MRGFVHTGLLAALLAGATHAAEITLLNGLILTGEVVSATSEGLAFKSAGRSRVYPWYSLAPGSRLRYEPANQPEPPPTVTPEKINVPPGAPGLSAPYTGPIDLTTERAWSGVTLTDHLFIALQTGTSPEDRVVYGFPLHAVDHLLYQAPDAARAVRIEASDASKIRSIFPSQEMTSSPGATRMSAKLTWTRHDQQYHLRAELRHQGIAYRLEGQAVRLFRGDAPVHVLPLLHPPALDFTLLAQNAETNLLGRIRMGPFTLHPGEGLNKTVKVEVKDASGKRVSEQTITHAETGANDFTLTLPLAGIATGARFTLRATADAGPVLGRLEVEQVFAR